MCKNVNDQAKSQYLKDLLDGKEPANVSSEEERKALEEDNLMLRAMLVRARVRRGF